MIEVKNGTRVSVEFVRQGGGYAGPAAIDGNRVMFPCQAGSLRGVKSGTVDGNPVQVVRMFPSPRITSLLVVEFTT